MSLKCDRERGKADFLTGLMEQHEPMAGMLRLIEGEAVVTNSTRPDLEAKTPVGS